LQVKRGIMELAYGKKVSQRNSGLIRNDYKKGRKWEKTEFGRKKRDTARIPSRKGSRRD